MNKQLIERITELFKEKLERKTGWGRNEIFQAYQDCVNQACLEFIDKKTTLTNLTP